MRSMCYLQSVCFVAFTRQECGTSTCHLKVACGWTTGLGMFQEMFYGHHVLRDRLWLLHPILIWDMSAEFPILSYSNYKLDMLWKSFRLCVCVRVYFNDAVICLGFCDRRASVGAGGAKLQHSGKICDSATLSSASPTWTVL
jgi:hypothetical protein